MFYNSKSNILIFFAFFFGTFACIWFYSYFFNNPKTIIAKAVANEYEKTLIEEIPPKSILIFGDIMLDRNVANRMNEFGYDYPFLNIKNILLDSDIVVANLEGVFTSNISISREDHTKLQFTFDKKLIPTLKEFNISLVSQANNHTSDFGIEGAQESKILLDQNGILTFGDFFNRNDEVIVKENVAFIGFNEFSYINTERILDLIRKYKAEGNKVIVMPHWGIEYVGVSNMSQQKLGREFIDAGADIVVGAHPHVVQEIELYQGKPIFYSLGNFIFDQDFSKSTTEGLGVKIIFDRDKTQITLIPINIIESQASLKIGEENTKFLDELSTKSSEEIRKEIAEGVLSF